MGQLTRDEARALLEKILSHSTADACEVNLSGSDSGNIRYARNTVTTSGTQRNLSAVIESSFGKKRGAVTVNEFDDEAIARAVRRAEELARLAPESPEFIGVLGPQEYRESAAYFDATANLTPTHRAQAAADSILPSREQGLTAAGFFRDSASFASMMNSEGLFAYHRSTNTSFSTTIRTPDGTGSGWASRHANDVAKIDTADASEVAIQKALASREPRAIEPGRYTVVLEPAASVDLISDMVGGYYGGGFSARSAEEGRSFLSTPGGGTKLGEQIVDERVTIFSDPTHPDVPVSPWAGDGRPRPRTVWIEKGVVKNLHYSRYWAAHKAVEATPEPSNKIMEGGDASLDDLVKSTRRGILVTRLWYIRSVDAQTLLHTGLTRDGTFFIENGEIAFAVKNLRFNESPLIMLNNLEELGRQQRVETEGDNTALLIPALKVRDFTFTSLSDAV